MGTLINKTSHRLGSGVFFATNDATGQMGDAQMVQYESLVFRGEIESIGRSANSKVAGGPIGSEPCLAVHCILCLLQGNRFHAGCSTRRVERSGYLRNAEEAMAHVCRNCDYFDGSGTYTASCPSCGGNMRLTLLDPRATATATLDPPAERTTEDSGECWRRTSHETGNGADFDNLYAYGYEEIEAPWTFRYAQIGAGVGAYFFVWRWGGRFLTSLSMASMDGPADEKQIVALGIGVLILNCAAALFGGGAAGIWAKNWVLQGLGVAAGVFVIPLVSMLIFAPESWPMFCISLAATSVLTMVGAYLGHLLVKPTRVPIS